MEEVLNIKIGGLSYKVANHWLAFWQGLNAGTWEPYTFATFKKFLREDKSYVDIGSWIGPTVLYGCQLARHCYAIEPDPKSFIILKENLSLNNFSNISTYELAIADRNGELKIGVFGVFGDSCTSFISGSLAIAVPCLTLEEFFTRNNITDCNFIKIDTEGGEFLILPSAKDFLKSFKPTIQIGLHSPHFANKELYFNTIIDSLSGIYPNFYLTNGTKKEWSFLPQLNWWNDIVVGVE